MDDNNICPCAGQEHDYDSNGDCRRCGFNQDEYEEQLALQKVIFFGSENE